mgnify:FL=1
MKLRDDVQRETSAKSNRVDAELGLAPAMYLAECEHNTKSPIPTSKIRAIDYWVHQGNRVVEDYSPSCKKRFPHQVDSTAWADDPWDAQVQRINQGRAIAKRLGVPFAVKSCFPLAQRDRDYIQLDDANLGRLTKGEAPLSIEGRAPSPETTQCRC